MNYTNVIAWHNLYTLAPFVGPFGWKVLQVGIVQDFNPQVRCVSNRLGALALLSLITSVTTTSSIGKRDQ